MTRKINVLVVEDDETLREALCDTLEYGGYSAVAACNGLEAVCHLKKNVFELIVSDVQMDEMDGFALLRKAKSNWSDIPFVLMTAHGSVEKAVEAMQEGASDYLVKPFEAQVLLEMVSRLAAPVRGKERGMIAEDPAMQNVCELVRRVAGNPATVMISGESGTGKEVVAHYIHEQSDRSEMPFVAINCAAIPEPMLESILFGYDKGAYTGAHQSRPGKFEQANGGTLLLDEISEMDLGLQAKILRVLQEKEVERLGGNTLIELDVRVLATTNRDLQAEVAQGRFREDLYYRLNVFPLRLPALRERPKDILPLAEALLQRHAAERQLLFSRDAQLKLLSHPWPGNVRELENCIQRVVILTTGSVISADDIFFEACISAHTTSPETESLADAQMLDGGLRDTEKQMIVNALTTVDGRRKDAAKILGISPRTLRYKLARLKEQGVAIPAA